MTSEMGLSLAGTPARNAAFRCTRSALGQRTPSTLCRPPTPPPPHRRPPSGPVSPLDRPPFAFITDANTQREIARHIYPDRSDKDTRLLSTERRIMRETLLRFSQPSYADYELPEKGRLRQVRSLRISLLCITRSSSRSVSFQKHISEERW